MQLSEIRAVITGGVSGLGLAVAEHLVAAGAKVALFDVNDDKGAAAVGAMGEASARYWKTDVTDEAGVAANMAAARDFLGGLNAAVNCAGIAEPPGSTVLTIASDEFREQIDAHLMSAFHLLQAAGRVFVEQGSGSVVLTGSAASLGMFGGSGYPAAKGGVNALALAAAADLRDHHVRVNVVMPGAKSRLSSGDDYVAHIEGLHRRGILDDPTRDAALDPAPPEYVAPLYVFLASDAAEHITGEIFSAAGGFIGRFESQQASFVAYRDHKGTSPYSLDELAGILAGPSGP